MGLLSGRSILGKLTSGSVSLGSIGEGLNDITGVSASAKQQYQHQLALQKDAQEFSKWQMQNAHQTEVEDLKKAGLNPVLSAGAGGGASAGVSMGGASAGTGADPISMIANIVNMSNSVRQTDAQVKKADADVTKALAEAGYKQHEIQYYLDNGYFPGQTKTKTTNTNFPFGFGGGTSETVPATNKNNKDIPNSARTNERKNKTVEEKRIQRLKEIGYRN